jgi:hydrophobic/amphiphilic exporter-1 (mainly G- bacteria), HAE1 family
VILVATTILFYVIPKGFFPTKTRARFSTTEAAQDISFDAMRAHQLAAMKIVAADPNVDGFISAIGRQSR